MKIRARILSDKKTCFSVFTKDFDLDKDAENKVYRLINNLKRPVKDVFELGETGFGDLNEEYFIVEFY